MPSKITQYDKATSDSYVMDNFLPESEVKKYSYTSSRVVQSNFNRYITQGKPKVTGYYTDWSQYDGRLDGDQTPKNRGRGVDLTLIDPCAFDKLIIGFAGCLGDLGEKMAAINAAAPHFGCTKNGQVTFLDPWGDCQSSRNCGFDGWVDLPMPASFNQGPTRGVLGGLRDLQRRALEQGHTLALSFSIGGWTMSYAFSDLVKNPTLRTAFCNSVVDIFKRFPMFSEVDIDWEYPGAVGNGNPNDPADGQNYVTLMNQLVTKFQQSGLGHIKISIATSADPETLEKAHVIALNTVCIPNGGLGINLMTYDFFGTPWAPQLAHHTNLYAQEGVWSVDNAVKYLLKIGFPASQITIGYAGYSRNAKGAVVDTKSPLVGRYDNSNTNTNTTGTFESGSTEWYDIINNYLDLEQQTGKNGFKVFTDTEADADYLYNPQSQFFLSIDTPRSVRAKGVYVTEKGLAGLMTWTADQDSSGLLVNAAREGLGCTIQTQKIDMQPFYFYGENYIPAPGDEPPVAVITVLQPQPVNPGDTVQLSGVDSSDPNHKKLTYLWNVAPLTAAGSLTKRDISVVVPATDVQSSYPIQLTVNNGSKSNSTTTMLLVAGGINLPPVAVITGPVPTIVNPGGQAMFSAKNSRDSDGDIIAYCWHLPTGASATGATNTVNLNFTVSANAIPGDVLEFGLTVTDNNGATGTTQEELVVAPLSSYPEWDKTIAYNADDKVSYHYGNWKAKWWNRDVAPGTEEIPGGGAYPWEALPLDVAPSNHPSSNITAYFGNSKKPR